MANSTFPNLVPVAHPDLGSRIKRPGCTEIMDPPRPTKMARTSSTRRAPSCPDQASDARSTSPMCCSSTRDTPPRLPPLPRLVSPDRTQSYSESVSTLPENAGKFVLAPSVIASNSQSGRPGGPTDTQLDAMQDIRVLRTMVISMEEELRVLKTKWADTLHDKRMLASAQRCAIEKHAACQAESIHNELQQLFRQQQILFATIQTAAQRLPLQSNGKEMFEELHFDPQLGRDPNDRRKMLQLHYERSLATVPVVVNKFSQLTLDQETALQGKLYTESRRVLPLSKIDVTGCKDCTLISSVFISEIQHTSLEDVYDGVLAYFNAIPAVVKRHFGIDAQRKKLDDTKRGVIYRRSTFEAVNSSWTINNIFCSDLTQSRGMIHIDVVTDDPLHPVPASASSHYCVCGVIVTPRKEPMTGKTLSVMLRRIVVYCYNMLPHEPAVMDDVQIIRPLLNGELINDSVCSYIQQLQQQQQQQQ
ncbi:unnamed protein product [Phytophthora fragariaefolia]|uniref:Unnamed protein product n=1 Tax=Phytophthora fragariaefolia TaxID=1490495 RepID=A0A9W6XU45_9STRA|nr:unnamed protein product [Phytophthora fragariaefolia]